MSKPVRIALVAEGITDCEVLMAAVESMLGSRSFILTLLQPEGNEQAGVGMSSDPGKAASAAAKGATLRQEADGLCK
ncbi:MAG: hypothetical protein ACHRHE_09575 [Tepidisphaerales bacterium]